MAQAAPTVVGIIRGSRQSSLRLLQGNETRLPGRPPGQPKTGGRKSGVPNKVTRDVKEMILKRGKPLELLCDVSRGVRIRVGPQAGPGEPEYMYPTLQDRIRAAETLLRKIAPDMKAIEQTIEANVRGADEPPPSPRETARAIFAVLHAADHTGGGPSLLDHLDPDRSGDTG